MAELPGIAADPISCRGRPDRADIADLDAGRPPLRRGDGRDRLQLLARADRLIAELDRLLAAQLNAILHHPRFQRLEASWRGLRYLVDAATGASAVKIRVIAVAWDEICRDLDRAAEFDQSQLFAKIYGEEFGTPGGEPYGLLVCDYYIRHIPGPGHRTDDVAALRALSQIAAAAFAPVVLGVSPSLFGLDGFDQLHAGIDLEATFRQLEYLRWRSLQETEDARFVGLVLPRVLARLPYRPGEARCGFRFEEDAAEQGHDAYLWGNPAYAFARVVVRAFSDYGWFAEIRGTDPETLAGGLVTDLPALDFATDRPGRIVRTSTEVLVSDRQEKELGDLGFIPLLKAANTDYAIFYGNQSIQRPKRYDRAAATANARLSAMLQYILCISRFAHYLKIMVRDRVGSITTAAECEDMLQRWLMSYTMANEDARLEVRARYPLRDARVQVREHAARPGSYSCTVHLQPHFQLDQVVSSFRLVTEVAPAQPQ